MRALVAGCARLAARRWRLLAFPFLVNAYWLTVGVLAMFYAIVAASWALLAGYAGQFSFGHMAFVSLGAYTSGPAGDDGSACRCRSAWSPAW